MVSEEGGVQIVDKNQITHTLKTIGSFEEVLKSVSGEDMNVKGVCKMSQQSINAWGIVMNEFNDVISTLENTSGVENRAFRAGFVKALEIVMRANNYRKGNVR